jgi:hypothetical protein
MSNVEQPSEPPRPGRDQRSVSRHLKWAVLLVVVAMVGAGVWVVVTSPSLDGAGYPSTTIAQTATYPAGVVDTSEPSGLAPLDATALPGYVESYVNDFTGSALPAGWRTFAGVPGGDPTGQFDPAHVVVGGGTLQLNAWKDPHYHNKWTTGGLCLCGKPQTYGAFFVRSRQTGGGPNEVELLWPQDNSWPPEIDFNETGGQTRLTSGTIHWTVVNHQIQYHVATDLSQWHTWGVVWTPNSVVFTLDGRLWATDVVAASIPHLPMTLDVEQRTVCDPLTQCPSRPTSLLVDWVAAFSPTTNAG